MRLEVDGTNSVIFIFGNFLFGIEPAYANAIRFSRVWLSMTTL